LPSAFAAPASASNNASFATRSPMPLDPSRDQMFKRFLDRIPPQDYSSK
jgi:hypothetical protein